jgi:hypothetical protein
MKRKGNISTMLAVASLLGGGIGPISSPGRSYSSSPYRPLNLNHPWFGSDLVDTAASLYTKRNNFNGTRKNKGHRRAARKKLGLRGVR